MYVYEMAKAKPEQLDEGSFDFSSELSWLLRDDPAIHEENRHTRPNILILMEGLNELHEALCWRDGIGGDEYSYDHLQTDYQPLPLQTAELEAESENEMVITLTYAPYQDCELEDESEGELKHGLSAKYWDIIECENSGYTQNEMRVVRRTYKLSLRKRKND